MNPEVPAEKTKDDFILEKIAQSGYPLEIVISSIISSKNDWEVFPNQYYFDKNIEKDREIDIKASANVNTIRLKNNLNWLENLSVNLSMFIECKRSVGNSWVFFRTPLPLKRISELRQIKVFSSFDVIDAPNLLGIYIHEVDGTHLDKCEVVCTAYQEIIDAPKKSDKRTDNIYKAAFSLIKAINYEIDMAKTKERNSIENQSDDGKISDFVFVDIFYPVIVVEGDLYEAMMKDGNIISTKKRQYIQLIVSYGDEHYTIDVISKDFFGEYFKQINEDLIKFSERSKAKKDYILGDYGEQVRRWNKTRLDKLQPDHNLISVG